GHTGRELRASIGTCVIFVAIALAALFRIGAAFSPAQAMLLHISAALWVASFIGYAGLFGGMLIRPRLQVRQPRTAV
ncbi:MAG: NnrS family protein, partial [Mesorhizobium sp.]